MTIGSCYFTNDAVYVYVNKKGTLERFQPIKWPAQLWLEILQGFGIYKSLPDLRKYLCENIR